VSSPFIGRLSEVYGYRRVLIGCSLLLLLGTLLYASATSLWHVLASQVRPCKAKSRTMNAHLYGKGPIDIHILLLGTLLYASATSLWHVLASQVRP
jgi:MFS family permease